MSKSKQIGTSFETLVARHAAKHPAFPDAKRKALSGSADEGDIWLHRYAIMECKAGKAAESASVAQIEDWLEETERERVNAGARLAALVVKTKGVGEAKVGQSAAYLWALFEQSGLDGQALEIPVRVTLDQALDVLAFQLGLELAS